MKAPSRGTARFRAQAEGTRLSSAWALVLLACLFAGPARADGGDYEDQLVASALAQQGLTPEPSPAGKPIEAVTVLGYDIVTEGDPWPRFFNSFHVTTRPWVVTRELLLHEGQPFDPRLAAESERDLRNLTIFAVARVVAAKGAHGGVVLVVVTKDLWSLRLNSEYQVIGTLIQLLHFQPSEHNLLGTGTHAALDFKLALDTLSLGESFRARRMFGTGLQWLQSAALVFNRDTGKLEGSYGSASFGRPLYTLEDTFALGVSASWDVERTRIFRGATVWQLPYPDDPSVTVPYIYDRREIDVGASATRSWGTTRKVDLTGTVGGYQHRYTVPLATTAPQAAKDWFAQTQIPRSEDAVYLGATLSAYEARYAVLRDYDTFALSEDFRLGYTLLFQARWADPAFFSPTRFVAVGTSARYRWLLGGDLLTVQGAGALRWMPDATGPGIRPPFVNRRVAFELENQSPKLWIGRFVVRGLLDWKADDLDHGLLFLGGTEGLRGTPPEAFSGTRALLVNAEYRTEPWVFHSFHTGLVLFYDVGSAYTASPQFVHTVGVGLRLLIPQFNLYPIRIDFGVSLNGPPTGFLDRFTSTFGQITDFRPAFLDAPL